MTFNHRVAGPNPARLTIFATFFAAVRQDMCYTRYMKHFLIPESGNFYKANLHCHTKLSDGRLTPAQTKEVYKSHGYAIVAFTDHELLHDNSALTDDGFLALTGYEIAANGPASGVGPFNEEKCVHLNLLGRDPHGVTHVCYHPDPVRWCDHEGVADIAPHFGEITPHENTAAWVNRVIREAREHGFIVAFNHPSWSCLNYEDYKDYEGFWGLELFNSGCDRAGNLDTPVVFDYFLRQGKFPFPLATDDNHGGLARVDVPGSDMLQGWVVVRAPRLDYDTVFAALERGDFYASTGPSFHELYVEDGAVHVSCSPVRRIWVNTAGRATFRAYPAAEGELIDKAELRFAYKDEAGAWKTGARGYIRVTIEDAAGRLAWSKALPVADLLD